MRKFLLIQAVVSLVCCFAYGAVVLEEDFEDTDAPEYRVVHVYVALCDNENQGIVKVNEELGNGQDPKWNLYWGAMYGVKAFFGRSPHWEKVEIEETARKIILDRAAFRLKDSETPVYVIAEAYDGAYMRSALMDFFNAAAGKGSMKVEIEDGDETIEVECAGAADVVCFVGHNGLMDEKMKSFPENKGEDNPERAIILACKSHKYFAEPLKKADCEPLITTTQLMCPEAYTLDAAIRSWATGDKAEDTLKKAGKAYAKYQKISDRAGTGVFKTGW